MKMYGMCSMYPASLYIPSQALLFIMGRLTSWRIPGNGPSEIAITILLFYFFFSLFFCKTFHDKSTLRFSDATFEFRSAVFLIFMTLVVEVSFK